jgi:predicted phosphodiesterase
MKTLVIGDLHFDNKPFGLLEAQAACVKQIYKKERGVDDVIFLGDLMMHRKPYPRVLLALKDAMDYISKKSNVTIIRGNHDSENKSDDGVTALSLMEKGNVKVVTHTWFDYKTKRSFIPHYEDETKIKEALAATPKGYSVFGHFGYCGALNSAGDADFTLAPGDFRHPTYLGHIHRFNCTDNITLLGTPYTTNFTEHLKENFYAVISDDKVKIKPVEFGPRHLIIDYDLVLENLDWINDPKYFTLVRVLINTVNPDQNGIAELLDGLSVGYVEVKYKPLSDEKLPQSNLDPDNPVTDVSDELIEDYINASNTNISKDLLLKGLQLIYENQQNRD